MADYQLATGPGGGIIIRARDGASFSEAKGNPDYEEYLVWLADGNTPDPADPLPDPGPAKITTDEVDAKVQAAAADVLAVDAKVDATKTELLDRIVALEAAVAALSKPVVPS